MTTSATDTWSQNRDEIISDALANVGAIGPGETATGRILDHAVRAINRLVKAIDADGQFLWRVSRLTFTTTTSTASYALNATVFAVDAPMRYTRSGEVQGTIIQPMTRDEYMQISDRTNTGAPSRYFIEKTLTGNGRELLTAYLWPVPDASSDTVEYAGAVRAKDTDAGSNTIDFPVPWIDVLIDGLTATLAPAYKQPQLASEYWSKFEAGKQRLLNADNERQDLVFVPRAC